MPDSVRDLLGHFVKARSAKGKCAGTRAVGTSASTPPNVHKLTTKIVTHQGPGEACHQ